ncbi:DNA-binding protein [Bacteroidia bacterium]|nr:DNA-binding protein [Bacteroidia bacterium]GHT80492.1 DNA-binding protein [Bacteroidia bacterium]
MTNEEKVQYWIELSDSDLEVAEAMLRGRYHLYVVFMCHQVVEKIFKGYYTKLTEDTPPFTHDLTVLATRGGFIDSLTAEQMLFVERLGPLNIRTRYPDYKRELAKTLSHAVCVEIVGQTKTLQQWTKEKLS